MAAQKRSRARAGSSKGSSSGRSASSSRSTKPRLPNLVYAQASPHSAGGTSLFDAGGAVNSQTVGSFVSQDEVVHAAVIKLQEAGFQVLQVSSTTINIAGPSRLYQDVFNTKLEAQERPVIKGGAKKDTATFVETPDVPQQGFVPTSDSGLADVLEGVALEEPVYFHQNAFAPNKSYWHLRVPGDVSLGVNADLAHRGGTTGRNVQVVMVDSGWFRHPYFTQRGYRSSPVVLGPASANPNDDESGHGTGESANVFAAAPDVDFTMVKINFANSTGAFNAAVALGPDIISCSWGSSIQNGPLSAVNQALAAAIAAAVASGIVVVVSAGNGHWGFPGQHPDVISAGGVYLEANGNMRASDYASGFASNVYPGRNCPDLSGLVGMKPGASYIMLPLQPGDAIDTGNAGGTHPPGDETAPNDGWAAFSGTSAAAPQLAGVAALIKEACPHLTPAQVRDIMMKSARDVTTGNCNTSTGGHAAGAGYDLATGAGLVDAHKAVLLAKLKCLGPIGPTITPVVTPVIKPVKPPIVIDPPRPPIRPEPIRPPIRPPIVPPRPIAPIVNPGPEQPGGRIIGPEVVQPGGSQLSAEDVASLEEMIIEGEGELGL